MVEWRFQTTSEVLRYKDYVLFYTVCHSKEQFDTPHRLYYNKKVLPSALWHFSARSQFNLKNKKMLNNIVFSFYYFFIFFLFFFFFGGGGGEGEEREM